MKLGNALRTGGRFSWLALALVLMGCTFPTSLFFEPPPVGQPGESFSVTLAPTATTAPTDTPFPPTEQPCAFAWANKDLPDETAVFQEALKKAGLAQVDVSLSAYGENCLDTQSKKVVSFSAMQTDFFFNIPVSNLNDQTGMGNLAAKLLKVIRDAPAGSWPGPNRGICGMTFQTLSASSMLRFSLDSGLRAIEAGLSGQELYALLSRS